MHRVYSAALSAEVTASAIQARHHRDAAQPVRSFFGEYLVLRQLPPAQGTAPLEISLAHAEDVARALRGALLCHAADPPPAVLSGHASDGRRLERPHVAFVSLPHARTQSPGGSTIAGAAIVLPRGIAPEERLEILLAAGRWERNGLELRLGRLGVMQLSRADDATTGAALHRSTWTGPSRHWATLTPIALPHNPGDLTARTPSKAARAARRAEEIIASSCAHIGLPRPVRVRVMRRSLFAGVPSASEFMPYPRSAARARPGADRFQRVCVHAELEFAEVVEGPVVIGAGRYFGVGLSRRLTES